MTIPFRVQGRALLADLSDGTKPPRDQSDGSGKDIKAPQRCRRGEHRAPTLVDAAHEHEVLEQPEILDQQAVSVMVGGGTWHGADPGGVGCLGRGVAEDGLAEGTSVTDFIRRTGVGAGAAKGCEVGQHGIAAADMGLVTAADPGGFAEQGPSSGFVRQKIQRPNRDQALVAADTAQIGGPSGWVG